MIHLTRRQSLILACALIFGFFALLWAVSRSSTKKYPPAAPAIATPTPVPQPQATANNSQFFLNEFHRSEIKDGRKIWEIKAKNGQYFPEKQSAEVKDADVWLFRENGEQIFLKAPEARLGFDGTAIRDAFFPDTVHVVYNDRMTVDTSVATYIKSEDTISSEHPVTIDSDMMHVDGNRFIAHVAEKSIIISGGVKTVIKPRQKKP